MKLSMDGFKALLIDMRVNLRGGYVRVTEHFLDNAQVGAVAKEMRRETVTQRMGRGAGGQAQKQTQTLESALDDAGIERPAAHAQEQGIVAMGTGGDIIVERSGHDGQYRHDPLLTALAGDGKAPAASSGLVAPGQ